METRESRLWQGGRMKKFVMVGMISLLLSGCTLLAAQSAGSEDDIRIWNEFVTALRKGEITPDRMRPYYDELKEPLMRFLEEMRAKATWTEWEAVPEIHRVGSRVHFLIPLTFDGRTADYCFTFLKEGDQWYFQHLEAINIRMDKVGALPTSTFPDVPEETKVHIREESRWSREIQVFNFIAKEKGKAAAFDFCRDGNGYFLAARVWVPFVEPSEAFILYLCREQANLIGNKVTLEKLEENEASVRMETYYFALYQATAHLSQQVSFEDYRQIFETIWQDRARAAGWDLAIEYSNEGYKGSACTLHFQKK
jgi:hypothetical protein